jgi:ATP-dependent DNA ligase
MLDLFDMGALGAEKFSKSFKLILLDVLMFKGVDTRQNSWSTRRVYLEDIKCSLAIQNVLIPNSIVDFKKDFFKQLVLSSSRGVVLKDTNSTYIGGINKNFLEIKVNTRSNKNVTLQDDWVSVKREAAANFDFDTYLAVSALSDKDNLKKITETLT